MRLSGTDHRPLDVAEGLPVADAIGVDRPAAGGLIGASEVLERADPSHGAIVVPEAPGADAEPADVLRRVSQVRELPVDHRGEPILVDDEVAEAEVPMDEPGLGGLGRSGPQPAQPQLDGRQGLADLIELALPLGDLT